MFLLYLILGVITFGVGFIAGAYYNSSPYDAGYEDGRREEQTQTHK